MENDLKNNAYHLAMHVDAAKQLKPTNYVRFFGKDYGNPRIMFVGNSITLHGILPEIGWLHEWGMAATELEKDYVHLCAAHIRNQHPNSQFCICQVAAWEKQYAHGNEILEQFQSARDFDADTIIVKLCANCPAEGFDEAVFTAQLEELMAYLNLSGKAKVLMATDFYHHPAESAICSFAARHQYPLCCLSDLEDRDEMKAIGQYEHIGICNHPGDLGMKTIAERICAFLPELIETGPCKGTQTDQFK